MEREIDSGGSAENGFVLVEKQFYPPGNQAASPWPSYRHVKQLINDKYIYVC